MKNQQTKDQLRITLLANAGIVLEYNGCTLLLDGIYQDDPHDFSNLPPHAWDCVSHYDYLLFTHAHSDHFSPELTYHFLQKYSVRGVLLPASHAFCCETLFPYIEKKQIPYLALDGDTPPMNIRVNSDISIRVLPTAHLDKHYRDVNHFCYLITCGGRSLLFTGDVDYTTETFACLNGQRLDAVFLNPLFFLMLDNPKYFQGKLNTGTLCVYHVPFPQDDTRKINDLLAHRLEILRDSGKTVVVLNEPFGQIVFPQ
ncbi:MBL fold metallo-hydrolase [Ruminococcus gauvreauii]|uniref:MBL fold metallo-hydrolase n=1 Tax=Ruminococcus gauvreauii TaxID=438033 RepID=UPI003983F131